MPLIDSRLAAGNAVAVLCKERFQATLVTAATRSVAHVVSVYVVCCALRVQKICCGPATMGCMPGIKMIHEALRRLGFSEGVRVL